MMFTINEAFNLRPIFKCKLQKLVKTSLRNMDHSKYRQKSLHFFFMLKSERFTRSLSDIIKN